MQYTYKVNYFKDLSLNMDSFLFIMIFKREFYIQCYEENSRRRTMNSTSDTMIFVTGMLFALTIMLCWKTKKVTDEVMKVLREKK